MNILIPSLIALAVAFVSLQQFLLAKEKFKLDLFEKRLAIYKAVQAYLEGVRKTQDASDALLQTFRDDTNTAKFLFDSDITTFIDTIYGLGVRLNLAHREACCETDTAIMKAKEIKKEALREFMAHHLHFDFRFLPYLQFRKWSGGFWIDVQDHKKKEKDYEAFRNELKSIDQSNLCA